MCRIGIAALIYATALVGPLIAQDNVSTRTKTLLAAEWKATNNDATSGIMLCLRALDEYIAHSAAPDPTKTIEKLRSGIAHIPKIDVSPLLDIAGPGSTFTGAYNLFNRAHNGGKMAEFLATATQQAVDSMNDKAKAALFDAAFKNLKDTYGKDPDGLDARVNKLYDKDPLRALYNLLNDLWTDQKSADIAAAKMETYRTCYLIDKYKLFGLAKTFLQ